MHRQGHDIFNNICPWLTGGISPNESFSAGIIKPLSMIGGTGTIRKAIVGFLKLYCLLM